MLVLMKVRLQFCYHFYLHMLYNYEKLWVTLSLLLWLIAMRCLPLMTWILLWIATGCFLLLLIILSQSNCLTWNLNMILLVLLSRRIPLYDGVSYLIFFCILLPPNTLAGILNWWSDLLSCLSMILRFLTEQRQKLL
jgi:hypothetical protein